MNIQNVFYYVAILLMIVIIAFTSFLIYLAWSLHKTATHILLRVEHRIASFMQMQKTEVIGWGASSLLAFGLSRIRGIFRCKS